jgi:anti-anti-sigma regulatory factor
MKPLNTPEENRFQNINFRWIFPEKMKLEKTMEYKDIFKNHEKNKNVVFDLRKTLDVHSSFIGFLINAKNIIEKNGGEFKLLASENVIKILGMLNLLNHFKIN